MVVDRMRFPRWHWLLFAMAATVAGCSEGAPSVERGRDTVLGTPWSNENVLLLVSTLVALPPTDVTPADLPSADSPGALAIQKYCTTCHALPSPLIHSATDWPGVLRRMWLRMDRVTSVFDIPIPTTAERVTILRYLLDNTLQVSSAELPAGPGREFFTSTCSRCHALPDPAQHSPEDWVAVVSRMAQRMEQILGEQASRSDLQRIVLYLEGVSREASGPTGNP